MLRRLLLLLAVTSLAACTSYTGVSRVGDQLYISGGTSYFFYTKPWVKRCTLDEHLLLCEELTEVPQKASATTGGGAEAAPAATAPPPSPAPSGSAAR